MWDHVDRGVEALFDLAVASYAAAKAFREIEKAYLRRQKRKRKDLSQKEKEKEKGD
jgi:hypothetical protein